MDQRELSCRCWRLVYAAMLCGLTATGRLEAQTQAAATEKGRLTITVTEPNSQSPVPCRIHLKDPAGNPVQAGALPFWRDHFVCPGTVQLELAAGAYSYEIERGPEYSQATGRVEVARGRTSAELVQIKRLANLPAAGWWPGELHVHRPVAEIELLMQAEDLHVAPVITWWNNRNLWANQEPLPDRQLHVFDGNRYYHVMAGEDEREGGALLYFNLAAPLPIAGADREFPSPMQFLSEARSRNCVWVDIEKPFWWDVPVWLASGQIDSIGIANNHMWRGKMYQSTRPTDEAWGKPRDMQRLPRPHGNGYWSQEIYYHVLNCGLRLSPSAGSASGVLPNPVGYNRVYVYTAGEFNYERWFAGLRAGRCFVTNGPLLRVQANGQHSGHVFQVAEENSIELELNAELTSREPVRTIEVIQNGQVVRQVSFDEWKRTGSLGKVRFQTSGWCLVRAMADDSHTFCFASTAPWYVEVGANRRRISKQSGQFFLDWVRERRERIKIDDPDRRAAVLKHHDDAEKYWSDLVAQANAE